MRRSATPKRVKVQRTRRVSSTAGKPAQVEVQAKRLAAKKTPKREGSEVRELEKRLAEALKQRAEAVEQQAATSELLSVISSSPGDVEPSFKAVVERALKLCEAADATIFLVEGDKLRAAARFGSSMTPVREGQTIPLTRGSVTGRAVIDRTAVHVEDLTAAPEEEFPIGRELQRRLGHRTALSVPLMREERAIGAIALWRMEVRRFADDQVALVKTFADQAVIAIENVRLFNELESRNHDLTEALERQTATSEILRAISQSPTDTQPIFDAIARAALELCRTASANVFTFDGKLVHLAAFVNVDPVYIEALRTFYPRPLGRDTAVLRAIQSRSVVVIPDVLEDKDYVPVIGTRATAGRFRSILAVPLMREGNAIGGIAVGRAEPGPFPDSQVALLQTFADQAVIAIENVRLFNETREALEQQRASAEVLAAISNSIVDTGPVFDRILASCEHLFTGKLVGINVLGQDGLLRLAAYHGPGREEVEKTFPAAIDDQTAAGVVLIRREVLHFPEVDAGSEVPPVTRRRCQAMGIKALVVAPMLWESEGLGSIFVARDYAGPFSDKEIALLKTFAHQAVIAIENARLFNETREALEQQTATSEILQVISQSPRDVQPVFHTIVDAALRLCTAAAANLFTFDGQMLHLAAFARPHPTASAATDLHGMHSNFPRPPGRELAGPRAVLTCSVVSIPDVLADDDYAFKEFALAGGFRSVVAVPLIRGGGPIGAIVVGRTEPGHFPAKQVALLQVFADQAVIAIENVRLFTQLEARTQQLTRSVDELKALGDVGQAVSSTLDLETVLSTIVSRAVHLAGMDGGSIWEYDDAGEEFYLHATDRLPNELVEVLRATPIRKGEGALGRLAIIGEPVEIRDIADESSYQSRLREILVRCGYQSVLAVPLLREDHLLGALAVNRTTPGEFVPEVIALLKTFATQSALAIQNARLYREIEVKSKELEAASRHKSEFLANMSHELRTPLNAIIGFSEVLSERMFGEINDKQAEYIGDILHSGQHLLSLINDILDLSKIEAGRMELEMSDFDLASTIENTLILVRERAQRRGITLGRTIDERLGIIRADERKVKQVLLNLLSNALKFTPEGGRIDVQGVARDSTAEISVTDTGVGIAPEDQEAVFEEFRQVGPAYKNVEGTGLGLAISRKFIELHGGKIWVTSKVGSGSTFAFSLPLQRLIA